MKFLVDAQLPARLATLLNEHGHDAIHTSGLSTGNRTTDREITDLADAQERVVVSKDRDFRDGHLLNKRPRRLLVVSTGNIANAELLRLVVENLEELIAAFAESDFVELGSHSLSVHLRPGSEPSGGNRL